MKLPKALLWRILSENESSGRFLQCKSFTRRLERSIGTAFLPLKKFPRLKFPSEHKNVYQVFPCGAFADACNEPGQRCFQFQGFVRKDSKSLPGCMCNILGRVSHGRGFHERAHTCNYAHASKENYEQKDNNNNHEAVWWDCLSGATTRTVSTGTWLCPTCATCLSASSHNCTVTCNYFILPLVWQAVAAATENRPQLCAPYREPCGMGQLCCKGYSCRYQDVTTGIGYCFWWREI